MDCLVAMCLGQKCLDCLMWAMPRTWRCSGTQCDIAFINATTAICGVILQVSLGKKLPTSNGPMRHCSSSSGSVCALAVCVCVLACLCVFVCLGLVCVCVFSCRLRPLALQCILFFHPMQARNWYICASIQQGSNDFGADCQHRKMTSNTCSSMRTCRMHVNLYGQNAVRPEGSGEFNQTQPNLPFQNCQGMLCAPEDT